MITDIQDQVIQKIVNEANKKLYVYELENSNRVSSFEPLPATQKVGGSKIKKLLHILKPEIRLGDKK